MVRTSILFAALAVLAACNRDKVPDAESAMKAAYACDTADGPIDENGLEEYADARGVIDKSTYWEIYHKGYTQNARQGLLAFGSIRIVDRKTGHCDGVILEPPPPDPTLNP
jgi:hypothetical protein